MPLVGFMGAHTAPSSASLPHSRGRDAGRTPGPQGGEERVPFGPRCWHKCSELCQREPPKVPSIQSSPASSLPSGGHAHRLRSWEELAGQVTTASRPSWSLWGAAAPRGEGDVSTVALQATV